VNWRNLLIGGLTTLVITIVGGVMVFYLTKEPKYPSERLVYTLKTSATFGSEQNKITFLTISVQNTGTKAARNVRIVGKFDQDSLIQDKRITLSVGPASIFQDESSSKLLAISIPILVPTESAEISLLVKGPEASKPDLGVQSEDSIAIQVPSPSLEPKTEGLHQRERLLVILLIPCALGLQLLLLRTRRWLPTKLPTRPSLNNTAFVYLQQGLTEEAEKLLKTEIGMHGADPFTLANYGVALGLSGNHDLAIKHLDAAWWWARSTSQKALIEYDRATLFISMRDLEGAKKHLRAAFSLGGREISRYCELSIHIRAAAAQDDEFDRLVQQRGR
jgi:hypothetical protein